MNFPFENANHLLRCKREARKGKCAFWCYNFKVIVSYLGKYVNFMMVNTHKSESLCTLGKQDIEKNDSFFHMCFSFRQEELLLLLL